MNLTKLISDVSPKQVVSVAAGLILIEHDDANRALMVPMQRRQCTLQTESLVGTGIESKVAEDSKAVTISESEGVVARMVTDRGIRRWDSTAPPKNSAAITSAVFTATFTEISSFNAGTCSNQSHRSQRG